MTVQSKVADVNARALERFATRAQRAAGVRGEVSVLIASSAELRRLNRRFRGKNEPTDVLSFPLADSRSNHRDTEARRILKRNVSVSLGLRGGFSGAGDIAISAEVGARNARRLGHSLADELKILILHGLLHLAGYDHEIDAGEMARKEARLRRALGLPTALIERSTPADGKIHYERAETRRSSFPRSSVPECRGERSTRRS